MLDLPLCASPQVPAGKPFRSVLFVVIAPPAQPARPQSP
jgi:hypothetical protein